MEAPKLGDGRIQLRRHKPDDLDAIVDQCTDPDMQRWTTIPVPYERRNAEEFLELVTRGWTEDTGFSFAIADAGDDTFLGTLGVRRDGSGRGEVGFGLRRVARGRGVMTAALLLLTEWAFDPAGLDLSVLHWRAVVGNWASRRVVWEAGFRVEGTVRGLLAQRGELHDCWIGSLRRDDPRQPPGPWFTAATLSANGVRLRPLRESDAAACVEAMTDPVTRHWFGGLPDPYTKETALQYIAGREEQHAGGRGVHWCVTGDDDRCAGGISLMSFDPETGSPLVGYWTHPAARGRGQATEALRLACRHAFASTGEGGLGLRRVELFAAAGNTASHRVAERAGFTRTGVRRGAERLGDGTYTDLVTYDLLASEA